jgi:hypothetical protein
MKTFGPELQSLKGLAIGALIGVARDMVTRSLPEQMKTQVADVMNNVTSKLGGEPIRGEVLGQFGADTGREEDDFRRAQEEAYRS